MNGTEMTWSVPKAVIDGYIKSAMVEALSKNGEALIGEYVDSVLNEEAPNQRYNRKKQTVADKLISKAVREEARAAIEEWVAEQRPRIRAKVREGLMRNDGELADVIAEKMVGTMESLRWKISAHDD